MRETSSRQRSDGTHKCVERFAHSKRVASQLPHTRSRPIFLCGRCCVSVLGGTRVRLRINRNQQPTPTATANQPPRKRASRTDTRDAQPALHGFVWQVVVREVLGLERTSLAYGSLANSNLPDRLREPTATETCEQGRSKARKPPLNGHCLVYVRQGGCTS